MDSVDLAAFIAAHRIAAEIMHLAEHTLTVEAAAGALDVQMDQIAKSILFLAGELPMLVIANGPSRIDYRRLAQYLGLSRKKVRMAGADEVLEIAGYSVGAMPPFGHKTQLRTLIDRRLFTQPLIFAGGGDVNALLKITPAEIARVTGAERVEVTGQ